MSERPKAPQPTVWGSVADFWEAVRTWEPCPNECGNCRVCAVEWAIGWSVAAESNPELVDRAVQRAADPNAAHRFGAWLSTPAVVGVVTDQTWED